MLDHKDSTAAVQKKTLQSLQEPSDNSHVDSGQVTAHMLTTWTTSSTSKN